MSACRLQIRACGGHRMQYVRAESQLRQPGRIRQTHEQEGLHAPQALTSIGLPGSVPIGWTCQSDLPWKVLLHQPC